MRFGRIDNLSFPLQSDLERIDLAGLSGDVFFLRVGDEVLELVKLD